MTCAQLKLAGIDDASAIALIEQQCHSHPWSIQMIEDGFSKDYLIVKAEVNAQIIGFYIVQQVFEQAELLDICVTPAMQGQGIAGQMMLHMTTQCRKNQAESLMLEVRESNLSAIHLYKKHQFAEISIRKNYYPTEQGRENALIMQKQLTA